MKPLRLIADDLTGALDSAAQFARPGRMIPVFLSHGPQAGLPAEFALDTASREVDSSGAEAIAALNAPLLAPSRGEISFKKVDSLLRGHPGRELSATLRAVPVERCVIAPAFPFHGRITRGGLQFVRRDGSWHRSGEDLRATLESRGMPVRLMRPGDPVPMGISLWDAETDDDLGRIALCGAESPGPVLWCGSGGLAAALSAPAMPLVALSRLGRPMLGLFGSDHPVTAAQLGACGDDVLGLVGGAAANAPRISAMLGGGGICLVRFDLADGVSRSEASASIAREIGELTRHIRPPGSLVVAGGETLRSLCLSLGTDHLCVSGQVAPGVPVSRMVGGHWDGVEIISKSGAFGDDALLLRIASRRAGT
jgi:uncharacterized protein YgbK (DUF1537 family)